jgi:hypothetical protein
MIPDRDYFLTRAEVRRRHDEADAERMVREAQRAAEVAHHAAEACDEQPRGAFAWLRRLAGAR